MIWIEHSQICMQQLKISFFSNSIKKHFYFEKILKGGKPSPTPPPLPIITKQYFALPP